MSNRISSLDRGYASGDLSLFPVHVDDKDSLYQASNNAETKLTTGLPFNGKKIIVESTEAFPPSGLVRVGPAAGLQGDAELIYYGSKNDTAFRDLVRGFAGSRQSQWPAGSFATNSVCAEHHNAVKDALINIEKALGLKVNPAAGSLSARLREMELRFLSPKATFRAFPRSALPGTPVKFQNFSEGMVIRYLWDFGDGGQSVDPNPSHTYAKEGVYTVKLHLITQDGAQNIATKNDYITVSYNEKPSFFYSEKISPRNYRFVDQTDGDIKERLWVFGDGRTETVSDPNRHFTNHVYSAPGTYVPSLLVVFADSKLKRLFLTEELEVK
jgi:hypothetical protein